MMQNAAQLHKNSMENRHVFQPTKTVKLTSQTKLQAITLTIQCASGLLSGTGVDCSLLVARVRNCIYIMTNKMSLQD